MTSIDRRPQGDDEMPRELWQLACKATASEVAYAGQVTNRWLDCRVRQGEYIDNVKLLGEWAFDQAVVGLRSGRWSAAGAHAAVRAPALDAASRDFVARATPQAWLAQVHAVADSIARSAEGHPEAVALAGRIRSLYAGAYARLSLGA